MMGGRGGGSGSRRSGAAVQTGGGSGTRRESDVPVVHGVKIRSARDLTDGQIRGAFQRMKGLTPGQFKDIWAAEETARSFGLGRVLEDWISGHTREMIEEHPHVWAAFRDMKLDKPLDLYRGIQTSSGLLKQKIAPGEVFNIREASSFSDSYNVARSFAEGDGPILRVRATRGADIRKFSKFQEEREVILGGKYRISQISTTGTGRQIIDIEEM